MKSTSIADLKNNLSSYLREVVRGQEILVRNRKKPIARIVPILPPPLEQEEESLVQEGSMRLPEKEATKAFWTRFFEKRGARISPAKAARAIVEDRNEE